MGKIMSLIMAFVVALLVSVPTLGQSEDKTEDKSAKPNVEKSAKVDEKSDKMSEKKPADLGPNDLEKLPDIVTGQKQVTADDFLGRVLWTINNFGGLPTVAKIAVIIMLLISLLKLSPLRKLWDEMGWAKPWLAPLLGVIVGILGFAGRDGVDAASILAYMSSGAGAIILRELLRSIKSIPGVDGIYDRIIDSLQGLLGGKK